MQTTPTADGWSSRLGFVLAAAGSAVGLGNLWRFPYVAGENGGAAFVLIYLACIALIGLPILASEVAIGRRGACHDPIGALTSLSRAAGASPRWGLVGLLGGTSAFFFLSFYNVVAGWSLVYVWYALRGTAASVPGGATEVFAGLTGNAPLMVALHLAFVVLTGAIVLGGVRDGIERSVRVMMPALLLILLGLIAYGVIETGEFGRAARFLFAPDFSRLTLKSLAEALGQAFFTLSVGVGGMLVYGSFLQESGGIARTAISVAAIDTAVALLAGLAIFPIVFATGIEPSAGPGLIFVSLPNAFVALPGGQWVGALFFVLVVFAALTSTISLLELLVELLREQLGWSRWQAVSRASAGYALVGIAAALSFNVWSDVRLFERGIFDLLVDLTSNIMLPLGGAGFALFAGWVMSRDSLAAELGVGEGWRLSAFRMLARVVAPIGVFIILLAALLQ